MPIDHSTPESLVASARDAIENNRGGEFCGALRPEDRPLICFGAFMGVAFLTAGEAMFGGDAASAQASEAKLQAFADAHGLSERLDQLETVNQEDSDAMTAAAKDWFADVDHAAFLDAAVKMLDDLSDEGEGGITVDLAGELTDLNVAGDAASGRCGDTDVQFERRDGQWLLVLPGV